MSGEVSAEELLRRIETIERELRGLRDYVEDMVKELHVFTTAQRRRLRDVRGDE